LLGLVGMTNLSRFVLVSATTLDYPPKISHSLLRRPREYLLLCRRWQHLCPCFPKRHFLILSSYSRVEFFTFCHKSDKERKHNNHIFHRIQYTPYMRFLQVSFFFVGSSLSFSYCFMGLSLFCHPLCLKTQWFSVMLSSWVPFASWCFCFGVAPWFIRPKLRTYVNFDYFEYGASSW
jgi:hypothetical protein